MDITGKLHLKFDTQDVSATFRKRDFVLLIDTNPEYPQYVMFQLTQEKCAFLDLMQVGVSINVAFNLRGRQWTNPQGETKYFNTLEAWRILPANSHSNPQVTAPSNAAPINAAPISPTTAVPIIPETQDTDDLPF